MPEATAIDARQYFETSTLADVSATVTLRGHRPPQPPHQRQQQQQRRHQRLLQPADDDDDDDAVVTMRPKAINRGGCMMWQPFGPDDCVDYVADANDGGRRGHHGNGGGGVVGGGADRGDDDPTNVNDDVANDVWGFRITGGAEFCMPITVFHVS